jgi:hypothetical protein
VYILACAMVELAMGACQFHRHRPQWGEGEEAMVGWKQAAACLSFLLQIVPLDLLMWAIVELAEGTSQFHCSHPHCGWKGRSGSGVEMSSCVTLISGAICHPGSPGMGHGGIGHGARQFHCHG